MTAVLEQRIIEEDGKKVLLINNRKLDQDAVFLRLHYESVVRETNDYYQCTECGSKIPAEKAMRDVYTGEKDANLNKLYSIGFYCPVCEHQSVKLPKHSKE